MAVMSRAASNPAEPSMRSSWSRIFSSKVANSVASKLVASGAVLITLRQPGSTGRPHHLDQDRLVRRAGRPIGADVGNWVQPYTRMVAPRTMDSVDAQRGKRAPIGKRHVRVDERHFDWIAQRLLLLRRQLRAQVC